MSALDIEALRSAAESIAKRPRADMRAAWRVVGEVLLAQAETRVGAVSHQQIEARCGEAGATDATGEVDGVRPIEVLRRGPKSPSERAVVSALLAKHLGEMLDGEGGPARLRARLPDLDWLEFTGPYAPYEAARVALAQDTRDRFEELLSGSDVIAGSPRAVAAVRALRGLSDERDPLDAPAAHPREGGADLSIAVDVAGHSRGFAQRLLSSFALWGAVRGAVATVGAWVFSFKRPGTLSLEGESLRLVGHSEVLGRTLKTWDVRMPVRELVELRKESRFPHAPAALSIAGLLLGVLVGAKKVFEGLGAKWFPVVAIGVGWILAGVALELVLRALWPGLAGRTRLTVRTKDSRALELENVSSDELDRLLDGVEAVLSSSRPAQSSPKPTRPREAPPARSGPVTMGADDRTVEDPVKLDEAGGAPTLLAGTETPKKKPSRR
jgi:hypothetical protein